MNWVAILLTPQLAIPTLVVAGATAIWAAWDVQEAPVSTRRVIARPRPDRDNVSRAFHAFQDGRFTDVLDRASARVERVSAHRFHRPVHKLPRTRSGARKLYPNQANKAIYLRRLAGRIDGLRTTAARREAGIWIRWDFWRSRAQLQARFLERLAPVLDDVARVSPRPRGAA
jgi:hypothetical protein